MKAEQREEVKARLIAGKEVPLRALEKYFERRHTDPMVQMQWEALTTADPNTRTITFPNGRIQRY